MLSNFLSFQSHLCPKLSSRRLDIFVWIDLGYLTGSWNSQSAAAMEQPEEGSVLRIYINENDRCERKLLCEWLIATARDNGIAGATVLRGMMGFGARGKIHSFEIRKLTQDLPMVLEFVDQQDKLESFLALVSNRIEQGLVTLQRADIHFYRPGSK